MYVCMPSPLQNAKHHAAHISMKIPNIPIYNDYVVMKPCACYLLTLQEMIYFLIFS